MKRWAFILCVAFAGSASAHAQSPPAWLPRYDLDLRVDPAARAITASMLVTWTNTGPATRTIVFNAHARYAIPDADIGLLAKTVEVLRLAPSESLSFDPPALDVSAAVLVSTHTRAGAEHKADPKTASLAYHYPDENPTSLVVQLPEPIESGGQVRLRLDFSYKLAPKKGRWGQWDGVTVLAQGLPTVAVYDNDGFHPSPFIPWHQPFYNEAGVYKVRLTLPAEQKLACSAAVARTVPAADGWVTHECVPACLRDFSFMCCARYEEHCAKVDGVDVRVLALPEHAHYGKEMVRFISEALPAYNRWFGRYPYPQFTVAEAYFGWNGNECGGLVMIDTRMMGMPTIAGAYVDYLISHELCHQWWYNVVGTNGYAETWMDEGLATYFSHRLTDEKRGKENKLLSYPPGLEWLPNIRREDFRNYGYLSVWKRGEGMPTVQDMPAYGHLMNLSAMTYDRGSKVVGLIEQRLGPDNMLDFMRLVFRKYQYRILRVADFQKELESFTGESWHDFFQHWVWGAGQCDWRVERVDVDADCRPFQSLLHRKKRGQEPTRVVIHLKQDKGFNENTVLGIRLKKDDGYAIRIPILPNVPFLDLPEQCARVYCKTSLPSPLGGEGLGVRGVKDDCHQTATVLVDITLPCPPQQISVDPDRILLDECPENNHWKREFRLRFSPLYTQLDEADVTNPYDRPSLIFGPYLYGSAYADPWFAKSPLLGFKAGVYRTQEYYAGGFVAYRSNDRNFVAGVEGVIDHFPFPKTQVGFLVERNLSEWDSRDVENSRGVVYFRNVITRGSSLYLPPFEYFESFAAFENRSLPNPRNSPPGAMPFDQRPSLGLHYHKYFLTPYWDPEGGVALDATYEYGPPIFGNEKSFHQAFGQVSWVKSMPKMDWLGSNAFADWLRDTRFAFRLGGASALPLRGQFFTLGGGDQFRGFDLAERQGSLTWLGSVEWRVPLCKDLGCDVCDHVAGIHGLFLAPFYDVGDCYVNGHSQGPVAHAFGVGLRCEVTWLGLIERTMFRFDVARTINADTPWQFWFGVMHPF